MLSLAVLLVSSNFVRVCNTLMMLNSGLRNWQHENDSNNNTNKEVLQDTALRYALGGHVGRGMELP